MQEKGILGRGFGYIGVGVGLFEFDWVSLILGIVFGIKFGFLFPFFFSLADFLYTYIYFIYFFIKSNYYTQNLILFIFYKFPKQNLTSFAITLNFYDNRKNIIFKPKFPKIDFHTFMKYNPQKQNTHNSLTLINLNEDSLRKNLQKHQKSHKSFPHH